jgi:transglutaminase-like putative cysteine protease
VTLRLDPVLRDVRPPVAGHRAPAWGIESEDDPVVRFARRVTAAAARSPLVDALALAEAIFERMAGRPDAGPPSALRMLAAFRGDCDHATALLVACLRALGHPARALVGYRLWQGRLAPHAWAECWEDRRGWFPVDATLPGMGPFDTHLRLFEGLGSPFTLGRALGRLGLERS